jgi:hypothetical protein
MYDRADFVFLRLGGGVPISSNHFVFPITLFLVVVVKWPRKYKTNSFYKKTFFEIFKTFFWLTRQASF